MSGGRSWRSPHFIHSASSTLQSLFPVEARQARFLCKDPASSSLSSRTALSIFCQSRYNDNETTRQKAASMFFSFSVLARAGALMSCAGLPSSVSKKGLKILVFSRLSLPYTLNNYFLGITSVAFWYSHTSEEKEPTETSKNSKEDSPRSGT